MDFINAEKLETCDGSDHVNEGVKGADFVQVDFVGLGSVHFGFSRAKAFENANGLLLDSRVEVAEGNALKDVVEAMVPVCMFVVFVMFVVFIARSLFAR